MLRRWASWRPGVLEACMIPGSHMINSIEVVQADNADLLAQAI